MPTTRYYTATTWSSLGQDQTGAVGRVAVLVMPVCAVCTSRLCVQQNFLAVAISLEDSIGVRA